jgi:hypothetical protein
MEYGISCSPAQMRKLKNGGAVTLTPNHFVDSSPHRIMVMPQTARRINTAMKKMKGVRIALKPEEDLVAMTEGGAISLKSIGKSLGKAFDPKKNGVAKTFAPVGKELVKTGNVIKRGFNKEIVDSGVGKEIAKNLIRAGTDVILPTALGAASMYLGDPTGMSGELVGNVAGNYIKGAAEKAGYGTKKGMRRMGVPVGARLAYDDLKQGGSTYAQRLARRTRNTFAPVAKVVKQVVKNPLVKEIGKVALREGAKAAGQALSSYTGNPAAGAAFERLAVAGGDKLIESEGNFKSAGRSAKKEAKLIAVEAVDDYIDANFTGAEKEVAQNALAGKYPSAADLVYDYGNSKLEELGSNAFVGYGVPRRTRGGLRMGKGMAHLTPAYAVAMRSATTGAGISSGFAVNDGRMTTSAPDLNLPIQTGSPFQRINSPAMSPFIPVSPQLANRPILGGSFLPAGGRMGGSFMPSG